MIDLCTFNEMQFSRTFDNDKDQYKFIFNNTSGFRTTIDYIVTKRYIYSTYSTSQFTAVCYL